MIKKLRLKFVLVTTISVVLMLLSLVAAINVINFLELNKKADAMLSFIEQNNGVLPRPNKTDTLPHKPNEFPREAMFDTRYFVVYYQGDNDILYTDTGNIYSATSKKASEYALEVLAQNKVTGYLDDYKYLNTRLNGMSAILFVDASRDIDLFRGFLTNSCIIAAAALLLIVIISYFLSPMAVKPIALAYEKQKRFITNASHEIKTPLAVISANMDIMEMSGESKWISSSKEQVLRLTELVNSLVALSRMEESEEVQKSNLALSELAEMVAESYESIALSKGKTFTTHIEGELCCLGDEKSLSQLFYLLLDNAFKYSNENGTIALSLLKKQDKRVITVTNTVDAIEKGNHKEYFDRFYRGDLSRNSETGGFGIGLSLAKSIVTKHRGRMTAKSDDEHSFTIEVTL